MAKDLNFVHGSCGVFQISVITVVQAILVHILFQLGFSFPMEINFWQRLGTSILFFVHLSTDGIVQNRLSIISLWEDSKRVLPTAVAVAPLLNVVSICFYLGLSKATVSDAMILSTATPVYTMVLSKFFLPDFMSWSYLLAGWALCALGTVIVGLVEVPRRSEPRPDQMFLNLVSVDRMQGVGWLVISSML